MNITLAAIESVNSEFRYSISIFSICAISSFALSVVVLRQKETKLAAIMVALVHIVFYITGYYFIWHAYYGCFNAVILKKEEVVLQYPKPLGKEISVPRINIESVHFGFPDRNFTQCYISISEKGGKSYKSSTFRAMPEDCKNYPRRIVQVEES